MQWSGLPACLCSKVSMLALSQDAIVTWTGLETASFAIPSRLGARSWAASPCSLRSLFLLCCPWNCVSGLQDTSSAGLSVDHVQRILAVDSQAAVRALLRECPNIAELEPAVIMARLMRLKVRAFLHTLCHLQCHLNVLPKALVSLTMVHPCLRFI